MADIDNAVNGAETNNGSSSTSSTSSEMLKPWMKTLGKEFYKNEDLGKYESLKDAVTDLLSRPAKKEIPEKYELRDGSDEVFRKAGLTKKEAEDIEKYYSKFIKTEPDLKEVFGDSYEDTFDKYRKGVNSISSDLMDDITKAGLDKNPTFVRILARVGKETGGTAFVADPRKESKAKQDGFLAIINKVRSGK